MPVRRRSGAGRAPVGRRSGAGRAPLGIYGVNIGYLYRIMKNNKLWECDLKP